MSGFRFESLPLMFITLIVVIGIIAITCRSYIRAAWRDRTS
jgi:hypothetical protein